ncbi:MAG TPA: tetratricopeptide repeat protein [Vicinamibacteria bacterium]
MERRRLLTVVFVGVSLSFALDPSRLQAAPPIQSENEIEESMRIFNRGKLLHQERQYREAIKEYQAALKLDAQNPFVLNALGLAFAAVREFPDALKAFNQALQLNPDLTDVYNNIGMVYAEQGAKEKAFEAFSRAVRNPNYTTPEKALYNMGNLYLEDGNLELAEMHVRRAVDKQPRFALAYRGLAKVYLKMNQIDLAVTQFEKAVELSPEDVESLFQLARIHQDKGEVEEARNLYRRVVEVDRSSTFGQLALARLDALKES